MGIKNYLKEQQARRKESKAFRKIVEKKALQERRKAYAKEALEVAKERGKAAARRPSFIKRTADSAVKRITTPPKRKPLAKRYVKTVYRRAAPKRKVGRRTRVVYREAPRREEPRPFNIGDVI